MDHSAHSFTIGELLDMNRKHFEPPFSKSALPVWRCPSCSEGAVSMVEGTLDVKETASSAASKTHDDWEPDWLRENVSVRLKCQNRNCNESLFLVGTTQAVEEYDEEFGWGLSNGIVPLYIHPSPLLFHTSENCLPEIKAEIDQASSLYWSSPSSSGNRLRVAVELLMDHLKIPTTQVAASGKIEVLTLHKRIVQFRTANPELGDLLLAVKWLGNYGSHGSELTQKDVLDAVELLAHVLEEIFEEKSSKLKAMAARINVAKGPV